jgi:hypothetical protein
VRTLPTLGLTCTVALLCGACGSSTPPGGPSGPSNPQAPPAGAILQIHTRVAYLRVGESEDVTVNLSSGGGNLTGVAMLESSDVNVVVVENNRRIRGVGAGAAQLRGSYQGLTSQVPQVVVEIGPTPNGGPSVSTATMVINEFRTSGPSGPNDEFIELRNLGSAPVGLTGWSIAINTATNHRESFGRIPGPAVVAPGCHYLLTGVGGPNAYSSGGIALGDFLSGRHQLRAPRPGREPHRPGGPERESALLRGLAAYGARRPQSRTSWRFQQQRF